MPADVGYMDTMRLSGRLAWVEREERRKTEEKEEQVRGEHRRRMNPQNKADFAFVSRERVGGTEVVRDAIRHELDLFVSELAVALARLPNIETWSADDVQMVSRLFVRNMVANAEEVIEMPAGRLDLEERIREGARRQMRLIVLGFRDWRS